MARIPQMQQVPTDLWQVVLRILLWAVRIPLCLLAVFTAACISLIGFLIVYRVTVGIVMWLLS
jgi:hypothetical protein